MKKRILTAVVGIPILFLMLSCGGYCIFATCLVLTALGLFEYATAMNLKLEQPISYIFIELLGLIITVIMKFDYYGLMPVLMLVFIAVFCYEIVQGVHGKQDIFRGIVTLFGLIYIPVLFGYLMMFENLHSGTYYLWMVFIIAFSTDTAAYFTGLAIGKTKLAPEISPKKTIAGAVGGLIASSVLTTLYGLLLTYGFHQSVPILAYTIIGLVGSVAGQCGDLTASMIKRKTGVKDFGKCLPGHGGILDRFDSILFIIPLVFVFTNYAMGMA